MKALKPFGFLGGNAAATNAPAEDGRVVELFRSRAELRKQHDELGQEVQRLRDRLKQQEGATARVQEMIEGLEKRLESADTGLSTLVFYHLRALWGDGREIIGLLVNGPGGQAGGARAQGVRARRQPAPVPAAQGLRAAAAPGGDHAGRRAPAVERARCARREARQVVAPLAAAQGAGATAGVAGCVAGRRCRAAGGARALRGNREGRAPANSRASRWKSRRAINLAAIACAEVLCLRLARTNLVAAARGAMSKREATEYYGDLAACVSIMSDIVKARNLLKQRAGITQEVAQRSERLRVHRRLSGRFRDGAHPRVLRACPKAT